MKKLGRLSLVAILCVIMASMTASTFLLKPVRAKPLPPYLAGADLRQDGNVTLSDFQVFVDIYHMTNTSVNWPTPIGNVNWTTPIETGWLSPSAADFNGNGRIDLSDLCSFGLAWYTNHT